MSKRSPSPVWSDGIHFVRRNAPGDNHPMPWYVGASRKTLAVMDRHTPTMDEGITIALRATKLWLKNNPADKAFYKEPRLPATSSLQGKRKGRTPKPPVVKLPPFSTYHFNCVVANPYAQVWQCVTLPHEKKSVGRRRADGSAPHQSEHNHDKGQCAVLIGQEPVRETDGSVRVFSSWQQADEFALDLYENAPEDEVITWHPPLTNQPTVVAATLHHDVFFDPFRNGEKRPFSLWNIPHKKPIYRDITRPAEPVGNDRTRQRSTAHLQQTNPEMYLKLQEQRRKDRAFDRVPAFSEAPLCFRSIWEAVAEAERRDKMMQGIAV